MIDAPNVMTEDEIANTLLGIKQLHEMRMWELDDTYCRKMELNQYCTDEAKLAARELANMGGILSTKKKGSKKHG